MFSFQNLLGPCYQQGNLEWTSDDSTLVTPVGNRIHLTNMKGNMGKTLPVESTSRFTCIHVSPNGLLLAAGNDIGEVYVVSLRSGGILNILKPGGSIKVIRFSPDGSMLAVHNSKSNVVIVYAVPGIKPIANPFDKHRTVPNLVEVEDLTWSEDSRLLVITTKNGLIEVYPMLKFENFSGAKLSGTTNLYLHPSIRSFFLSCYDFFVVDQNGTIRIWECDKTPDCFIVEEEKQVNDDNVPAKRPRMGDPNARTELITYGKKKNISYRRKGDDLHFSDLPDIFTGRRPPITSVDYCKAESLLVCAFELTFVLVKMPDFLAIKTFTVNLESPCNTLKIDSKAELIAFGMGEKGELFVWNWESEHQVLKQQGHYDIIDCFDFNDECTAVVTGGVDSKLKLWDLRSGQCIKTYTEHTGSITDVSFTKKNSVVSSSLDGTVRAFDVARHRNYRTLVTPHPTQFDCLAVDSLSTMVVAAANDFNIYLWSLETGKLLQTLEGHEAQVTAMAFSPVNESSSFVSVSLDRTLRMWDVFSKSGDRERIPLNTEGTCVAYAPNGQQFAVGTLDGNLSFFNSSGQEKGSINGRLHLAPGRSPSDMITASKSQQSKQFRTLAFSPDGRLLLAAGPAKTLCMYNVMEQHLIETFSVTKNQSYAGVQAFVNRRNMTDFGVKQSIEDRETSDNLALPGVRKGDMASRTFTDEIRVTCIRFGSNGKTFGASTPEGLLIYSSEQSELFDPIDATEMIKPETIKKKLESKEFDLALAYALQLNELPYIKLAVEAIKPVFIRGIVGRMPLKYAKLLLIFLSDQLLKSRRLEFYLEWAKVVLEFNGRQFKLDLSEVDPHINALKTAINIVEKNISELVQKNIDSINFFATRFGVLDSSEDIELAPYRIRDNRIKIPPPPFLESQVLMGSDSDDDMLIKSIDKYQLPLSSNRN